MKCPFCNRKMVPYFGSKSVVVCIWRECPCAGNPLKTTFINEMHQQKADAQRATALQKKLDRLTIAAQRCLNKFAHERIHAELKEALKEIDDIKD